MRQWPRLLRFARSCRSAETLRAGSDSPELRCNIAAPRRRPDREENWKRAVPARILVCVSQAASVSGESPQRLIVDFVRGSFWKRFSKRKTVRHHVERQVCRAKLLEVDQRRASAIRSQECLNRYAIFLIW